MATLPSHCVCQNSLSEAIKKQNYSLHIRWLPECLLCLQDGQVPQSLPNKNRNPSVSAWRGHAADDREGHRLGLCPWDSKMASQLWRTRGLSRQHLQMPLPCWHAGMKRVCRLQTGPLGSSCHTCRTRQEVLLGRV